MTDLPTVTRCTIAEQGKCNLLSQSQAIAKEMSAAYDFEKVERERVEAEMELLKCCGSCIDFYLCETEYRIDAGNRSCYFTPSRWEPRGG